MGFAVGLPMKRVLGARVVVSMDNCVSSVQLNNETGDSWWCDS